MNRSLYHAACSCVLLLGSAALVFAQAQQPAQPRTGQPRAVQPPQPGQPGQLGQPGQPGQFGRPGGLQAQQLEPSIVTLLIIDNNKEIALGQLGQQTTQNEHVKHYCEMLVKDHSSFVQKLQERSGSSGRPTQRFGATTGADQGLATTGRDATRDAAATTKQDRTLPGQDLQTATKQERGQKDQGQETRTAADQLRGQTGQRITVAKPVIGNQPGSELLQLHHEVAEKCLDSARQDAEKLGPEFDKHFLGAQIVAHKGMLDKLQVFGQHVSPQTRQLLAQAQETTKRHLEEATNLHQQLSKEGGGARTLDRTTERTTKDRE